MESERSQAEDEAQQQQQQQQQPQQPQQPQQQQQAQPQQEPPASVQAGVLSSLPKYDDLRFNHPSPERVGNVDVLRREESADSSANSDDETAVCHLAGIFNFDVDGDSGIFANAVEQASIIALAAHHLNTGDGSVVSEVAGLSERCDVRFTVEYVDTEYLPHKAINEAIRLTDRPGGAAGAAGREPLPCAFLGAKRSYVSAPTSVITGLRQYPQISPWSTMPDLDDKSKYPLFGRTVPSDHGTAEAIVLALRQHLDVTNLAVLHVDDAYATAFASGLQSAAASRAPEMKVTPVDMPFSPSDGDLRRVIRNLKRTEFRYIFCILYVGPSRVETLLSMAYDEGIAGTGQHTWLFSDAVGMSLTWDSHPVNSPMHHALKGTGLIQATGGLPDSPRLIEFNRQLKTLRNSKDLEYVLSKTPFYNGTVAELDDHLDRWSEISEPEPYSPFLYDAVIATGLAACDAASKSSNGSYFDGPSHFEAFKKTAFDGTSGRVVMNEETGTREAVSAYYALTNFVEDVKSDSGSNTSSTGSVQFKAVHSASFENGSWVELTPFVYADGSNTPPPDLPPVELERNLLDTGGRAAGFAMCGVALLLAVGFAGWTGWNKKSPVVMSAQPVFLYLICIGVFVFASTVIPLSFDEGLASPEGCSIACMASPWLASIGFGVAFSALFTKMYRVNKIFRSSHGWRRVRVTPWDVAKPMILILGGNILVLALMTALSPPTWEVDVLSLDSHGRPDATRGYCSWTGALPYVATLGVLNFGCLAFSVYQAYQARNISTEYAESEYVFKIQITILLVGFLGFPMLALTKDNTTAFYFVSAAIFFLVSCSILLLIFVPKVMAFVKFKKTPVGGSSHISFGSAGRHAFSSDEYSTSVQENGLKILIPERERELSHKVRALEGSLRDAQRRIEELEQLTILDSESCRLAADARDGNTEMQMQMQFPSLESESCRLSASAMDDTEMQMDAHTSEANSTNSSEDC